ncbi:N-acetyltransferase [Mesorhizobium sp. NPDC059025]|uniref:N-acetyltransferase n=1 Tax=unclassified Mesorhizobium TaxID=325217 RepID=UPI00369A86A0
MLPFWGYDEAVAAWVAEHIPGCARGFENCRALGVLDGEQLAAGVVFHNWEPEHGVIELSGASTTQRWLTKPVLWQMFAYPFLGIGCQLVVMRVSERNEQWNGRGLPRLLKAYGFEVTPIARLYGRHENGRLFSLTDDAWRANGFHKKELANHG